MADGRNGTLDTGMTTDLSRRIYEHRERIRGGFTKRYGCTPRVWWEPFEAITAAISRERTLRGYPQAWELNLIEAETPEWEDLSERLDG